jgi:hypothetical protein
LSSSLPISRLAIAAAFRLYASQGWTSTAHGTYARVATTANGSTSPVDQFGVEQDGGITAPPTVTGGSKGQGTFNAGVGYYVAGQPFTFSNLTGQSTLAQLPTIGADTVLGSIAGGTPITLSQAQITSLINPATPRCRARSRHGRTTPRHISVVTEAMRR